MAFNQQEQEIIRTGIENGRSRDEVKNAIANFRAGIKPQPVVSEQPQENVFSRIGSEISTTGERAGLAIRGEEEFAGRTPLRRGFEAAAEASSAPLRVGFQLLPEVARSGLSDAAQAVAKPVGVGIGSLVDFLGSQEALQKFVTEHPEAAKALEEAAGVGSAAGQISGNLLATQAVTKGAETAVNVGAKAGGKAVRATENLIKRSGEVLRPKRTPQQAIGQVLQGKKEITTRDIEAFKSIDTNKVKSFRDLQKQVDQSIGKLSDDVDDVLRQDSKRYSLQELGTRTQAGSGQIIERNFVDTAIQNLKELYSKTADDVALADIDDLERLARSRGLTRLEVNDLSRLYNQEFGAKAFSRVSGDPLTSVNAQAYENIRTGLKEVARRGIGGAEAKAADQTISSLYNIRKLVTKNAESAQRLQQKIVERGLLEKAGHGFAKYSDILTGGSIRGFVSGLLPRGAGYKVLNALDLEDRLAENLKIIQAGLQSQSDDVIIQAAKHIANPTDDFFILGAAGDGIEGQIRRKTIDQVNMLANEGTKEVFIPGTRRVLNPDLASRIIEDVAVDLSDDAAQLLRESVITQGTTAQQIFDVARSLIRQ